MLQIFFRHVVPLQLGHLHLQSFAHELEHDEHGLDWRFIRERIISSRKDLLVVVCRSI